ncbi:hypothetical protein BU23DRAFT_574648 [Bimuria novae-zelandiae CBS 107.79]|uniref:Uncharacterized protein n=1 Tax=Bimuria novae-zelandiae CBS 107.79 TaxID=1447943 RepID=A0A6A5ULV2_9PLEO|nr:hypothetical protein BU23DRAFT_574648 [Bimuria novae-zelandiae CBS 107.79]
MCLIARSARDEIDFLLNQARATEGDGPPRPENAQAPEAVLKNWQRWIRVRSTYISFFKEDPFLVRGGVLPQNAKPGDPAPGHGFYTRGFYDRVTKEFCSGQRGINNPTLVCTDADYKFIKTGASDPGDPQGRKIEDTHPQCANVGGVWYGPHMPQGQQYQFSPPPKEPGQGPLCNHEQVLARTSLQDPVIWFCPLGLDTKVHTAITIQDLRPNIKQSVVRYGKKTGIRETIKKALDLGGVTTLENIKGDGHDTMPLTWLHEMHHLIKKSIDQPAVDEEGKKLTKAKGVYVAERSQYEEQEAEVESYGYELCRNLAREGVRGMINPDSLAFFALAMFFDEHDWSRGFAMPLKKPWFGDSRDIRRLGDTR